MNLIHSGNAGDYIECVGRKEGDELKSWYALAQILVLPSKADAFGTVVDEALIMGEYVMVSKYAGSCCLIDNDNGEVIDVDKESINFHNMCERVAVLNADVKKRDCKRRLQFDVRMIDCVGWLEDMIETS